MSRQNIWIAASDGNLNYVKEQISSGKHTANDHDNSGYTPIHAAASYGHLDLLRYLISVGGDVNIQDEDGDTPLHSVEDVTTAAVLVQEFNANWRHKNHEGQTPLAKAEEEDEFPELIAYYRSLQGSSAIPEKSNTEEQSSNGQSSSTGSSSQNEPSLIEQLYANPGVSLSYKSVEGSEGDNDDELGGLDEDQRKELDTIINGENAEENLQKFMQKIIEKSLTGQVDESVEHDEKRKRVE